MKKVLLFIDVLVLLGFAFAIFLWFGNNKKEADFRFKNFTFTIPKDVQTEKISEDQFKLLGENIDAVVEIYVDSIGNVFSQDEMYFNLFMKNDIKVDLIKKERIDDVDTLCFHKTEDNDLLCYFDTFNNFAYEVLLNDTDDVQKLKPVLEILQTATYDTKSKQKYEYYMTYEKLLDSLEKKISTDK